MRLLRLYMFMLNKIMSFKIVHLLTSVILGQIGGCMIRKLHSTTGRSQSFISEKQDHTLLMEANHFNFNFKRHADARTDFLSGCLRTAILTYSLITWIMAIEESGFI